MYNRIVMQIVTGMLLSMVLMGCGQSYDDELTELEAIAETTEIDLTAEGDGNPVSSGSIQKTVKVFVCGAVKQPGVYELTADARIADALLAAGDFASDADATYLNQAEILTDGARIYVPTVEETAQMDGFSLVEAQESAQTGIDLNHATLQELKTLPGIGDVKASAIIAYRESRGRFETVEQIMEVEGIKQGLYEQIKDEICVRTE